MKKQSIDSRRGSALLLTLMVVSLLLVIVLSFVVFVRMQLREVTNQQNLLIARQNSILGMNLAIAQLQKYAGADQRITAPATTVYPAKDVTRGTGPLYDNGSFGYRSFAAVSSARSYLTQVETYLVPNERTDWDQSLRNWWNNNGNARNPHWTAVYDSSLRVDRATNPTGTPVDLSPERYENGITTVFGEPKRNQLPVWLVSGNEKLNFNPAIDSSYPAGYLTPDISLVNNTNAVELVGVGSATISTSSVDGLDGIVRALKQPIDNGNYAFWVGDESTKANFAVREPDSFVNAPVGSTLYRNRLQVPQRIGWERMEGFDTVFDNTPSMNVNDPDFAKLVSHNQVELIDPGFAQPAQNAFHHITSYSRSLFTDTALGGLKKDLTRYLEDGDGLSDNDPIADPDHYDSGDPRFAAWGGTNAGFPNTSTAALDGIPTWGQIRDWYQNESNSGGAITPDADAGVGPVLTYVMFNGGWSYDGSSKMIRWHWMPCIVLWNPYDVGLSNATYDVEVEFTPALWQGFVCKPNPTIAELQAQAGANWQPDADLLNDANGDGILTNDWTFTDTTGATRTILINPSQRGTNAPDTIDVDNGPWVQDSDLDDGVTDAFGRLFYKLENPGDSDIYVSNHRVGGNSPPYGSTGGRNTATRLTPHHDTASPGYNRPLKRPMKLRLSGSFDAGQAKVFTLNSNQEWVKGSTLPMTNDFDPDFPNYMWFDVMEVVDGPASASGLRWNFSEVSGGNGFPNPKVTIKLSGKTLFQAEAFGALEGDDSWRAARGKDYDSYNDYSTTANEDADGDGTRNQDERAPKFVSRWRRLYDFGTDFDNNIKTQTGSETDASNWAYGMTWIQPLTGPGGFGADSVHNYISAFSRFNFAASFYDSNPIVEAFRDRNDENNYDSNGNREGLITLLSVRQRDDEGIGGASEVKWDNNQADGTDGYALITYRNVDGAYKGQNNISVRNAKRAQSEILSIGQLQQVNLSRYLWQPAFPIGNSWAPPYTDREAIAGIHSRPVGTGKNPTASNPIWSVKSNPAYPVPGVFPNNADLGTRRLYYSNNNSWVDIVTPGNTMMDLSYLLNENLWDRYFLSTITSTANLSTPLPNSRIRYNDNVATAPSGDLTDFDKAAAYLENLGALNVNSTSVEAWKALLTAFRDLQLGDNPADTVPIARTLDPIEDSVTFIFDENLNTNINNNDIGAVSSGKDYTKPVSGFRYLTDGMIQILAERIVDEVRLRGPFYSMSDFINRRLVAPEGSNSPSSDWYLARTDGKVNDSPIPGDNHPDFMNPGYDPFIGLQGLAGSLQRALQVSGINGGVNNPTLGKSGTATSDRYDMIYTAKIRTGPGADYVNNGGQNWGGSNAIGGTTSNIADKHTQEPTMRSHLDTEHLVGAPAGEAGQLFDGAPGFVTQGDLLAMIGPALTARGDTFLVRAYGEVGAANSTQPDARAWLEAVVQRISEPVNPEASDPWRPADIFGRRFKIVSMRWLSPDEI